MLIFFYFILHYKNNILFYKSIIYAHIKDSMCCNEDSLWSPTKCSLILKLLFKEVWTRANFSLPICILYPWHTPYSPATALIKSMNCKSAKYKISMFFNAVSIKLKNTECRVLTVYNIMNK